MVKFFKLVENKRTEAAVRKSRVSMNPATALQAVPAQQSHVGQKLSELTTRRVVLGVLSIMFILPIWDASGGLYGGPEDFAEGGLRQLHNMAINEPDSPAFYPALEVRLSQLISCRRMNNRLLVNVTMPDLGQSCLVGRL